MALEIPVADGKDALNLDFRKKCQDGEYTFLRHECPICLQADFETIGQCSWGNFRWGICRRCGLVQMYERFERNSLNRYYTSGHYQAVCMGGLDDYTHFVLEKEIQALYFINLLKKYCNICGEIYNPSNKKILEIGCGSGGILYSLKQEGYRVEGYDLDEYRINYGKQYIDELICADALDNHIEYLGVDYVLMSNVLEHIDDPKSLLRDLSVRISEKAKIIIDVPNYEFLCDYSNNIRFLHISHIWYFSPITLERLLRECGFKIVYVECRGAAMTMICEKADEEIQEYNAYWHSKAIWEHAKMEFDGDSVFYKGKTRLHTIFNNARKVK